VNGHDADVTDVLRRSMVARIATLSASGRPSVNPLYFVVRNGNIWLGTADWTLAARNVECDARVSVLFDADRRPNTRVVRIRGRATLRIDRAAARAYNRRVLRKYVLTPGGIGNLLLHVRKLPLRRQYYAQSAKKGRPCVIEVTPEEIDVLIGDPRAARA
jgi:general stress protein 26